jgi:hypothetical protein
MGGGYRPERQCHCDGRCDRDGPDNYYECCRRMENRIPIAGNYHFQVNTVASRPTLIVTCVTIAPQTAYATLIAASSANNTGVGLLQEERPNVSGFIAKGGLLYAGLNGTNRYVENPIKILSTSLRFCISGISAHCASKWIGAICIDWLRYRLPRPFARRVGFKGG